MKKTLMLIIALVLIAGTPVFAAPSADEIVTLANQASYYAGEDGRAHVKMTITAADGGERSREFVILRKDLPHDDQKFYVYFETPADVYKMAFLVWKNVAREDDRWLWLPALNLKKRIAPGDKRTSFVGSDFYYEDVSGRSLDEDRHELIEETATRYVIRNTPKNPSTVEFSHYIVQIDKTTYLPVKAEYFDQSGTVYRVVEALEVATVQGYPTVTKAAARDLLSGSTTINHFTQIEYDLGLQERIFTERFLRRAPREVTR